MGRKRNRRFPSRKASGLEHKHSEGQGRGLGVHVGCDGRALRPRVFLRGAGVGLVILRPRKAVSGVFRDVTRTSRPHPQYGHVAEARACFASVSSSVKWEELFRGRCPGPCLEWCLVLLWMKSSRHTAVVGLATVYEKVSHPSQGPAHSADLLTPAAHAPVGGSSWAPWGGLPRRPRQGPARGAELGGLPPPLSGGQGGGGRAGLGAGALAESPAPRLPR